MSQTITQPDNTRITLNKSENYRESYANSVQVRPSVWDFFLVFGTMEQRAADEVTVENFQGVYVSPQQAKAMLNLLAANVAQYEQAFGTIALEPTDAQRFRPATNGAPVH